MKMIIENSRNTQLQELTHVLKNAKEAEALAKRGRVDAEEQIAALVPTGDVGQKTIALDDGTKITVKRGLSYKAQTDEIWQCFRAAGIPHPPLKSKTTVELDAKGYEWLRGNDPQMFGIISQYVTVTPKKVAVILVVK